MSIFRKTTEADIDRSVEKVQKTLSKHKSQGHTDVVRQSADTVAARARMAAGYDR